MGGDVWVDSREGAGSGFGFFLPLEAVEDVEPEDITAPSWMDRAIALDDDGMNRTVLLKQLGLIGLKTIGRRSDRRYCGRASFPARYRISGPRRLGWRCVRSSACTSRAVYARWHIPFGERTDKSADGRDGLRSAAATPGFAHRNDGLSDLAGAAGICRAGVRNDDRKCTSASVT